MVEQAEQVQDTQDQADSPADNEQKAIAAMESVMSKYDGTDSEPSDANRTEQLDEQADNDAGNEDSEATDQETDSGEDSDSTSEDAPSQKELDAGRAFGWTEEQVAMMSPEKRSTLVEQRAARDRLMSRRGNEKQAEQEDKESDGPPQRDAKGRFTKGADKDDNLDIDIPDLDPEEYGDEFASVTKQTKKVIGSLANQVRELKSELETYRQEYEQNSERQAMQAVENWVESLPESARARYGTEIDLNGDSPESYMVRDLVEEAAVLMEAAQARGRNMTFQDALTRAHTAITGEPIGKPDTKRKPTKTLRQTRRGSRQTSPSVSTQEQAIAAIEAVQRKYQ
jgi:hypothetical protein